MLFGRDHLRALAGIARAAVAGLLAAVPATGELRVVERAEILEAMKACRGYDLTATANAARFHAEVLLRLARAARARDPEGPPLRIDSAAWFSAYLERSDLTAKQAPLFARLAYEHRQETEVDYRRARVLGRLEDPRPLLAANVRIGWPETGGGPTSYSYEDPKASPQLRVTTQSLLTYRLLDYGDMIVYGDIRGLQGRPTSGVLGALFDVIGEARIVESRMAVAPDGTQVSRGRGRKGLIEVTATVTIHPDGRAHRGVPPDRPDLAALEERLKQPLKLDFVPFGDVSDADP